MQQLNVVQDMPVDHNQVQKSVPVEVAETSSEAAEEICGIPETRVVGRIDKIPVPGVSVEAVVFMIKVSNINIGQTITVVVSHIHSHTRFGNAVLTVGNSRFQASFVELPVPIVKIEKVSNAVIGDEGIDVAVEIQIRQSYPEGFAFRQIDIGRPGDVLKGSVTIISIQCR